MPTPRIPMRQIRQTLHLHYQAGLSYAEVGRALGVPKSTIGKIVSFARAAGVDWALAQTLSDDELDRRLYQPPVPRASRRLEPDFALVHQELKRPGVTLMLLWEEYQRGLAATGEPAYKYTSFCVKYAAWAACLKRSMRQIHVAGERIFVDYAGQTVPIVDASTGAITPAQVFVAVLGASNYTYACATATQTAADWVGSIIGGFEFFGGVSQLVVPDQTRALIARPDRYEPTVGRLVEELCSHYDVAVLPARPAHPRDKPKVEVAVQVVERWILARLRHRTFFSLVDVNTAIAELLPALNQRPFKKLPGCRASAFAELDQPALRALPATRMTIARFKWARVNIDYHVELDGHYYSVPHRLVGTRVELRVTQRTVEAYVGQQRVACHAYSRLRGGHSTNPEHMPASHRAHREWTPQRLIAWGERIGVACGKVVCWQMQHRPHPEQGYRACLGLQRLARQYGAQRLEAACARALTVASPTYRSIASILNSGLDRHPLPSASPPTPMPEHDNVRGPTYYH
ncbi:MAG: IS21 family transposase [Burkholderiales bacterium]|nr:IS21 family transposase [Burkholderiales bacterium]